MEKTLEVINQMRADGVIGKYAIGGAVGAFFYIEPAATYDLDVFIALDAQEGGVVVLTPIYDYLKTKGYREEGVTIMIENWAVQFLPAGSPLLLEGLDAAKEMQFQGVSTRVFPAEYLMAIALQTGRSKDLARLVQFAEEQVADEAMLNDILERHNLLDKWRTFNNRFRSNQ